MSIFRKVACATGCGMNKTNSFLIEILAFINSNFFEVSLKNQKPGVSGELVGVIPAAGSASRLGQLPCSKELLPVGFHKDRKGEPLQPKPVGHYVLERMKTAEVANVYIILRKGKWDIPAYFGDGKIVNMNIAYLLMDLPYGVPFTIDQAYPFLEDATVVFGFPDIIFEPRDAFKQLLCAQNDSNADVVLGLFVAQKPHKADMVELDAGGRVRRFEIKPASTRLRYAWIIAVWNYSFTEFLHRHISVNPEMDPPKKELFLGDVFQAAIDDDLQIASVIFENNRYYDIGTPEDLVKAVNQIDF
jgi:glucose-1-phosphate thymidylyltransferase